jgi:hypothetical protein
LKGLQEDTLSANRVEFCVGWLKCERDEVTKMTDLQHPAFPAQKSGRPAAKDIQKKRIKAGIATNPLARQDAFPLGKAGG